MNIEKIFVSGVTVDLTLPHEQQGLFIQFANLTTTDAPLVKGASIDVYDEGGSITIQRDVTYNMQGNVLIDSDCSLIFGVEPACFGVDPIGKFKSEYEKQGIPVPYIPVPIPYAGHWYVGIDEAAERYQDLFKMATGVEIAKTKIIATDTELKLEFKWKKVGKNTRK